LSIFTFQKVPPPGVVAPRLYRLPFTSARLRCAGPCQSRCRATWPPSRCPYPSQVGHYAPRAFDLPQRPLKKPRTSEGPGKVSLNSLLSAAMDVELTAAEQADLWSINPPFGGCGRWLEVLRCFDFRAPSIGRARANSPRPPGTRRDCFRRLLRQRNHPARSLRAHEPAMPARCCS
jgi:hypothetical protein